MKALIKRSIIKIIIVIILCSIFGIITTNLTPHLTNDLALSQLENEDINWSIFQTWHQIQNFIGVFYFLIIAIVSYSIGKDILNYIERKKDK